MLEAISKHGIGRTDLIIEDPELPFYHIKQSLIGDDDETEAEDEEEDKNKASNSKFIRPRDLVVARRIDSLCDLVLNPKPSSVRQTRKRRSAASRGGGRKRTKIDHAVEENTKEEALSDEEMDEEEEEEETYEDDEGNAQSPAANDNIFQEVSQTEPQQEEKTEMEEVKQDDVPVAAVKEEGKQEIKEEDQVKDEDQVMKDEPQDVKESEE